MSKISYVALSLIGAVPGGYLSYLLVMAMLNNFSKMPGMMRVIVCVILAMSALVTVIPIGILIFVKSEKEEAEEGSPAESSAAEETLEEVSDEADVEEIEEIAEDGVEDIYEADEDRLE